jgi:hypothetical protein
VIPDILTSAMAASTPLASPCLVAILLVIQPRSGSGARLVFHYPPEPLSASEELADKESLEYASSSSSASGSSSEEEDQSLGPARAQKTGQRNSRKLTLADNEEEQKHRAGDQYTEETQSQPSWEPLFGLGSSGLAGLLAAARIWHMRKFELGINDLCFVGRPVFVRENGHWKQQKSQKIGQSNANLPDQPPGARILLKDEVSENEENEDSADPENSQSSSKKSPLTMFNLVFVLDPPTLEHDLRVKEMYKHVIKRFTRALKREQARHEFVWKESEMIQLIKSKHVAQHSSAKSLYPELLVKSQLAAAIASVYRAVSTSHIASFSLSPSTSVVLQIPPVTSISVLPSLTDPPVPAGLWLTTFNDATPSSSEIEGLATTSPGQLAKHVTLLLKETPQRIIKDAQAIGGPMAAPLARFVTALRPTKSFHKLAITSQISWRETEVLASHLISSRRAVCIPPLHQRDTYIVSPNADMSTLKTACKAYSLVFPTLPGLATILSALSDTPRPWMMLIPSSDHKQAYYEILAWLLKNGWVTQLRTFAYVRVSPEVKKAVREQDRKDELERKATEAATRAADAQNTNPNSFLDDPDDNASITKTPTNGTTSHHSFSSNTSRRPSLMSHPSSDQRQHTLSSMATHDPNAASMVLNPSRASPLESRWLDHIANSLLTTQYSPTEISMEERVELRGYWLRFVKYFNGAEPLEFIPVREGLKRTVVWEVLGRMGLEFDAGVEGERQGGNGRILITVRHW